MKGKNPRVKFSDHLKGKTGPKWYSVEGMESIEKTLKVVFLIHCNTSIHAYNHQCFLISTPYRDLQHLNYRVPGNFL